MTLLEPDSVPYDAEWRVGSQNDVVRFYPVVLAQARQRLHVNCTIAAGKSGFAHGL